MPCWHGLEKCQVEQVQYMFRQPSSFRDQLDTVVSNNIESNMEKLFCSQCQCSPTVNSTVSVRDTARRHSHHRMVASYMHTFILLLVTQVGLARVPRSHFRSTQWRALPAWLTFGSRLKFGPMKNQKNCRYGWCKVVLKLRPRQSCFLSPLGHEQLCLQGVVRVLSHY